MMLGIVIIAFQAEILVLLAYWRGQTRLQLEINENLIKTNDDLIEHLAAQGRRISGLSQIEQVRGEELASHHKTLMELLKKDRKPS